MVYNNVLAYCKEEGISVMKFEQICGIGNGVVSGWKNGNPRLETLQKMEKSTGKPISYWLQEDDG
jgi:transcriptional regulator with XRE-family HTH domain